MRFKVLGEVHGRGLTDTRFGHVTPNEAGWRHGVDPGRVRRDVRTANTLTKLPDIAGALECGVVSVDRVREVCRQVNVRNGFLLESIQGELLGVIGARSGVAVFRAGRVADCVVRRW